MVLFSIARVGEWGAGESRAGLGLQRPRWGDTSLQPPEQGNRIKIMLFFSFPVWRGQQEQTNPVESAYGARVAVSSGREFGCRTGSLMFVCPCRPRQTGPLPVLRMWLLRGDGSQRGGWGDGAGVGGIELRVVR
jgi:hypothetical protein